MPKMHFKRTFGSVIKERRRHLGMTQAQVAAKVGCRPNYVGYLENGARRPSQKLVLRIAKALELDAKELFLFANPAVREVLAFKPAPVGAWEAFKADRGAQTRHGITKKEMAALQAISELGEVCAKRDFLHILQTIRQALTDE